MNRSTFLLQVILLLPVFFTGCKGDDNGDQDDFDRKSMLTNYSSNIIIPAYSDLKNTGSTLEKDILSFTTGPTLATLTKARESLKSAWITWQWASPFEFGPAEDLMLRSNLNTFPTDTARINSKISSGDYLLTGVNDYQAKGFPALDYLLNSKSDSATLKAYTTSPEAENQKKYLTVVAQNVASLTSDVFNKWDPAGGNYTSTFITATGTDIGSSTGYVVNQLNKDLEILKNFKIGLPLGKSTSDIPIPDKTEAFFGGYSTNLAHENLKAIEAIYHGRSKNGTDGPGLHEYLAYLNATYDQSLLSDVISGQFSTTLNDLEKIQDPLSEAVVSDRATVDKAYLEVKRLIILLKTDMPSAMGVAITYQDNDGD